MFVITDLLQFIETAIMISMLSFIVFFYVKTKDKLVKKNLIVLVPIAFLIVMLYIYDYFTTHYVLLVGEQFNLEYTYAVFSVAVMGAVTAIVGLLTRYGIELFPIKPYIRKITYRAVVSFICVVFVGTIVSFMFYFGNDLLGAIGAAINFYYPLTSLGVFVIAVILIFQYRNIEEPSNKRQARAYIIAFAPQIVYTLLDVLLLRNYVLQLTHLSYTIFAILAFYNISSHVFINYEQEELNSISEAELVHRLGLTERECEVVGLLIDGLMNRELAEELNISENTVKTHVKSIYRKLGVSNRLQLIHLLRMQKNETHLER
ncbi:hypothetical protein JR334_06315 [Clostridia bacterium]|nr:hypothetical protein JR334_06315 [Clostridia bacterium]